MRLKDRSREVLPVFTNPGIPVHMTVAVDNDDSNTKMVNLYSGLAS
jgi:hypothetical protein